MKEQLKKVEEFQKAFGHPVAPNKTFITAKRFVLRHELMDEENAEYLEACFNNNITEIADALGDQLYILCGTIIEHGLQDIIVEVFNAIHESNMSKLGKDGKPIHREDGKILKGPNYFKPTERIEKLLKLS